VFADFAATMALYFAAAFAGPQGVQWCKTVLIDVLLFVRLLPLIFEEIHKRCTLVFGLIVFICYSYKKKKKN
jgi:hypothetical protein